MTPIHDSKGRNDDLGRELRQRLDALAAARQALVESWQGLAQSLARAAPAGRTDDLLALLEEATKAEPALADSPLLAELRRDVSLPGRDALRVILEAALGDALAPAACHNLALYHLAESNRCLGCGLAERALDHAERVVAYLAVPLADVDYLHQFGVRRAADYGTDVGADALAPLASLVEQQVTAYFGSLPDQLRSLGRDDLTRRAADLPLMLKAELRAARIVRNLGGLRLTPEVTRGVGPALIRLRELHGPLESFLAEQLPCRTAGPQAIGQILDFAAESAARTVDPTLARELELLFSPLCLVAVLEREDQPGLALEKLADAAPLCRQGDGRLCRLVDECEVSLLLKTGERAIASPEADDMKGALAHWRRALELAKGNDQETATAQRVRETALARGRSLIRGKRFDEAIELLSSVSQWCGGDDVQGLLAEACTDRGIKLANADDLWRGLDDLRRAISLNEHSARARSNWLTVAERIVDAEAWSDPPRIAALLEETQVVVEAGLKQNPDDADLRRKLDWVVRELEEHTKRRGGATDTRDEVRSMLGDLLNMD